MEGAKHCGARSRTERPTSIQASGRFCFAREHARGWGGGEGGREEPLKQDVLLLVEYSFSLAFRVGSSDETLI